MGSSEGRPNLPTRLALSDNIYVSDLNFDRVLIMSRTLSYIGDVLSCLRYPTTIWFDEETARLYVANKYEHDTYVSGCIKVYQV